MHEDCEGASASSHIGRNGKLWFLERVDSEVFPNRDLTLTTATNLCGAEGCFQVFHASDVSA